VVAANLSANLSVNFPSVQHSPSRGDREQVLCVFEPPTSKAIARPVCFTAQSASLHHRHVVGVLCRTIY
jgi:hypothetical protein